MPKSHSISNGKICGAWPSAKLHDVTSLLQDGTHYSPKTTTGPFRYLTSRNIRPAHLDTTHCLYISADEHDRIYSACPVKFGDVLLTKDGASVGNACLNTLREPFSLLSSVAALRGADNILDNRYLLQYLMSPLGQKAMKAAIAGQAITRITLQTIGGLRIPLPPISEQEEIASLLGTWDHAMDRLSAILKLKRRVKRGLMQQLLTGRRQFPQFAGQKWREVRIGDVLLDVTRTVRLEPTKPYRLVSIRRRSGGFFDREVKLGQEIGYPTLDRLHTGDFVIARRQVLHGAMAIVPPKFHGSFVSNAYAILVARDPKTFSLPFFNFISRQPRLYYIAHRCSYGVAIEKMFFRLDWFLKERLRIPASLAEQQKIAAVLTTADHEINLLERQLTTLRQQKKGMMQKLLTGDVRVKLPQCVTK